MVFGEHQTFGFG